MRALKTLWKMNLFLTKNLAHYNTDCLYEFYVYRIDVYEFSMCGFSREEFYLLLFCSKIVKRTKTNFGITRIKIPIPTLLYFYKLISKTLAQFYVRTHSGITLNKNRKILEKIYTLKKQKKIPKKTLSPTPSTYFYKLIFNTLAQFWVRAHSGTTLNKNLKVLERYTS